MSARTILTGAHQRHVLKKSANGNTYALVTVREGSGEAARWWSAFVFGVDAVAEVERLQPGEPIAVAGEIEAGVYTPNGGTPRVSLSIRVDGVLTARKPPKRHAPDKRLRPASRAASVDGPNDDIPI